jgi:hypothetical protein
VPQLTTAEIQKAIDAGGTISIPAGTYLLTQTLVVTKSHTIIQGSGPDTVFVFKPTLPQVHCVNDRAFTTACGIVDTPHRRIAAPIAVGDTSFTADGDVSDLQRGDWLVVADFDGVPGEVVVIDWVQVEATEGNDVIIQTPFRTAFFDLRPWDPVRSGLGFRKVPDLIEGTQFRDFSLVVPDSGQDAPGISVFAAKDTVVENISVQDADGQALYSYLSKGLTITECQSTTGSVLSELGATVDLKLNANTFGSDSGVALGLDFGTAFFQMTGNNIDSSVDIGMYLLDGIHDGTVTNNSIAFVSSSGAYNAGNAVGILIRGTQRVNVTDNFLAGGSGPASIGLSIGTAYSLDVPMLSSGNTVEPNRFGLQWGVDYDPSNAP